MDSTFAAFQGKLFPFLDSSVYLNVRLYFELNFILLNFPSVDPPVVPWTIKPFLLPRGSPLTFWRCYDFSESPFPPTSLHFLPFPYSPTCAVFQLVLATGKHWGKIKNREGEAQIFIALPHFAPLVVSPTLTHGFIASLPGLSWFQLL